MTYLFIFFVLLIIISPLMWFRQSPRQKLTICMRKKAANLGMTVRLSTSADNQLEKKRLDCITYKLSWHIDTVKSSKPHMEDWLLVKSTKRGKASIWLEWNWLGEPCCEDITEDIDLALKNLPIAISALQARSDGIMIYWKEEGEEEDVVRIYESLFTLRNAIRC